MLAMRRPSLSRGRLSSSKSVQVNGQEESVPSKKDRVPSMLIISHVCKLLILRGRFLGSTLYEIGDPIPPIWHKCIPNGPGLGVGEGDPVKMRSPPALTRQTSYM
jgi:hypothetical protein